MLQFDAIKDEINRHPPIIVEFEAAEAWSLISMLQLASRNPSIVDCMGIATDKAIVKITNSFTLSKEVKEYLKNGWNSGFDVPFKKSGSLIAVLEDDFLALKVALNTATQIAAITGNTTFQQMSEQIRISTSQFLEEMREEETLNKIVHNNHKFKNSPDETS